MDTAVFSSFRREALVLEPAPPAAEARTVAFDLLALADPACCSVTAACGAAAGVEVAGAAGRYRPARPVAGDPHTGLVAGTLILTARGEVAVAALRPGDAVMTLRGPALLPVLWVGQSVAAEPPVVIEAGALGPQRPNARLTVAAGQPIFLDPLPVPARALINGTTVQQTATHDAALFQIDVGGSEVLFAHNVPLASTQRTLA